MKIPSDAELSQMAKLAAAFIAQGSVQNMSVPPSYIAQMVAEIQTSRAAAAQDAAQRGNQG